MAQYPRNDDADNHKSSNAEGAISLPAAAAAREKELKTVTHIQLLSLHSF